MGLPGIVFRFLWALWQVNEACSEIPRITVHKQLKVWAGDTFNLARLIPLPPPPPNIEAYSVFQGESDYLGVLCLSTFR